MQYLKQFNESYSWNKLTVNDIFNLIDFADFKNLYPDYDNNDSDYDMDEYFFNSKEQAENYANEILDIFNNFPNEITIYRSIRVKSVDDIWWDNLGDHWSFDKESAINFAKNQVQGNYLLIGKIKAEDVDWESTVSNYIHFSGNYDSYDENELTVNGFKVYDVTAEKILKNESNFNRNISPEISHKVYNWNGYKRYEYEFLFNSLNIAVQFTQDKMYNTSYWERSYGVMENGEISDDQLGLGVKDTLDLVSIVSDITATFLDKQIDILLINHKNMRNENIITDKLNKRAKLNYNFLKNKIPNNYTISYYSNGRNYITCIITKKNVIITNLTRNSTKII